MLVSIYVLTVNAQISVGLKEGDWVEYRGSYTGNPPDDYPKNLRIEVQSIQGTNLTVKITQEQLSGKEQTITETISLENGAPDAIIIPANLDEGDLVNNEDLGAFLIEEIIDYNYEGVTREAVYANVAWVDFTWDRTTGVLIEAEQEEDTWTQRLIAVDTNIVPSQSIALDSTITYVIALGVVVIIIIVIIIILKRKK